MTYEGTQSFLSLTKKSSLKTIKYNLNTFKLFFQYEQSSFFKPNYLQIRQ